MLDACSWLNETRREGIAHRAAIVLEGIRVGEQRARIDRGRIEAAAILRVGQKVLDDQRRIGVDSFDASSGERTKDLEVVIADRGASRRDCIRLPRIGCALIGERVVWVVRPKIRPDVCGVVAVENTQAEFDRKVNREVFPDESNP